MRSRVQRFAHLLERLGLAMAGAASGLFVAIHVGSSVDALTTEAFLLAIETAYEGSSALLRRLDATKLAIRAQTPFGEVTLGDILLTSYRGHIDHFHLPQLRAFLSAERPAER